MKRIIYLDHAATTPLDPNVKKAMEPYWIDRFGNPSSLYWLGREANEAVGQSREGIADIMNCNPQEIVFTNGGTESDNLAILGAARANRDKGNHIITTEIEHHAVLNACRQLEREGFVVSYVPVDNDGLVNPENVRKAICPETILISVMYANNEIGTIQPIDKIGQIASQKNVLFHTDACQAAGALSLDTTVLNVDLLTLNGSKIYGPKGIGILYIKEGVRIQPLIFGGGQEKGLRPGTENVPAIVGLAQALEIAQERKDQDNKRLTELRDRLIAGILQAVPKVRLNGHPENRLPNNVNISILDIEGESLLLALEELGIAASTGSACTAGDLRPSHVILALGLSYEAAHGSLRFTLGRETTKDDIDYVLMVLPGIVKKLRDISPLDLPLERFERSNDEQD